MRCLILGCGYLGSRVATLWQGQGHEVVALTRSPQRAADFLRQGITPVVGDLLDDNCLLHAGQFDICLQAVGYDRKAAASKHEVYVHGLQRALSQLVDRCDRVLSVSSTSVYGQTNGEWVDESSPCHPTGESGQICLEAEAAVGKSPWGRGGSGTVLRLSGIYGPGRLLAKAETLRAGEPLTGRGDAWLNLIHVDDAARAVVAWGDLPAPLPSVLLLSDAEPVRRHDYYTLLAQLAGAPPPAFDDSCAASSAIGGARHFTAERGLNKRCRSNLALETLKLSLLFPSVTTGLPQAWEATPNPS